MFLNILANIPSKNNLEQNNENDNENNKNEIPPIEVPKVKLGPLVRFVKVSQKMFPIMLKGVVRTDPEKENTWEAQIRIAGKKSRDDHFVKIGEKIPATDWMLKAIKHETIIVNDYEDDRYEMTISQGKQVKILKKNQKYASGIPRYHIRFFPDAKARIIENGETIILKWKDQSEKWIFSYKNKIPTLTRDFKDTDDSDENQDEPVVLKQYKQSDSVKWTKAQ